MRGQPNTYARKLIARFEAAVEAYAFRGAGHPEDEPRVAEEYRQAKAALVAYVDRMTSRG